MNRGRPLVVLVEDAASDEGTARRMLSRLHPDAALEVFRTGEALLEHLRDREPARWWPRLFIVDVNLAGRTGIEILAALKRSGWARVPVVVLSGSAEAHDVQRCYDLGAAGYLTKPMGATELNGTWSAITAYWLCTAVPTTPPGGR